VVVAVGLFHRREEKVARSIDYFSDHLMDDYIAAIHNMVLEYEASGLDETHWLGGKKRWGGSWRRSLGNRRRNILSDP